MHTIFVHDFISTIQYNTTVKRIMSYMLDLACFSTIQYNTTVKPADWYHGSASGFSTIQYNTTVKRW